jgi:hypothetical protein
MQILEGGFWGYQGVCVFLGKASTLKKMFDYKSIFGMISLKIALRIE